MNIKKIQTCASLFRHSHQVHRSARMENSPHGKGPGCARKLTLGVVSMLATQLISQINNTGCVHVIGILGRYIFCLVSTIFPGTFDISSRQAAFPRCR